RSAAKAGWSREYALKDRRYLPGGDIGSSDAMDTVTGPSGVNTALYSPSDWRQLAARSTVAPSGSVTVRIVPRPRFSTTMRTGCAEVTAYTWTSEPCSSRV